MIGPAIAAGMKQHHDLARGRVNRTQIAPFVLIAQDTGIGQVIGLGPAAVLFRDDVIDPMGNECHQLGEEAILAADFGPVAHQPPQGRRNMRLAHEPFAPLSLRTALVLARRTRCSTYWYWSHSR